MSNSINANPLHVEFGFEYTDLLDEVPADVEPLDERGFHMVCFNEDGTDIIVDPEEGVDLIGEVIVIDIVA